MITAQRERRPKPELDIAQEYEVPDSLDQLTQLSMQRRIPDYIRCDNGSEFTAKTVPQWLADLGVKTLYIERGSPRENGCRESFNGKLWDELLNVEIFDTLVEAQAVGLT